MDSNTELRLYRKLQLARQIEEAIRKDYFQDEMKTPVHLGIGAEAIAVGVLGAMPKETRVFGTYRNHNLFSALSENTDLFFGEMFGRATGCAEGKAGSMHLTSLEDGLVLTSAVVGSTIPVAVGYAFALKYQGANTPVAAFFGDGAIEEGVFYESLNFACLHKLNVVLICEDNEYAIHTHKKDRQAYSDIKPMVQGFGCHYLEGDGKNVKEVFALTQKALALQNEKPGPVLIKLDYLRFLQHVGPLEDFDAGYRAKPARMEVNYDPVNIYKKILESQGIDSGQLKKIEEDVRSQIQKSLAIARAAPFATSESLCRQVYANQTSKDLNQFSE